MRKAVQHSDAKSSLDGETAGTERQLPNLFREQWDQAAFETLVQLHGPMVYGVCRRVLRNHQDAEDAFQATFLILVRKATAIKRQQALGNWLYRVAFHAALKLKAAAAKRRGREQQMSQLPEPAAAPAELWRELEPLLDEELNRLPDKFRIPVVLCDLEGKTRKQVAQELGCPDGTVASRLARGRAMLAQRLTRHGLTLSTAALGTLLSQNAASAAVPTALAISTAHAAGIVATGQAAPVVVVSAKVSALTNSVLKSMLLAKLKLALAALVLTVAAGLGTTAWMQAPEVPPSPPIPPDLVAALERNVAELSPLDITWERTRERDDPVEEQKTRGYAGMIGPQKVHVLWDRGKYHVFFWQPVLRAEGANEHIPFDYWQDEFAFDGAISDVATLMPAETFGMDVNKNRGSGELLVRQHRFPIEKLVNNIGHARLVRKVADRINFIRLAGFWLPMTWAEHLRPPRPLALYLANLPDAATTVGQAEIDGEMYRTIEIRRQRRLARMFLDPQKNYALRRLIEQNSQGDVLFVSDCLDFVRLDGRSVWLPRVIQNTVSAGVGNWPSFMSPKEPRVSQGPPLRETYQVTELRTDPIPNAKFMIDLVPGTMLLDGTHARADEFEEGGVPYLVPPDLADLEQAIALALRREPRSNDSAAGPPGNDGGGPNGVAPGQRLQSNPQRAKWLLLFIGLNILLAAAAGIYYFVCRRRGSGRSR